MATRKPSSRFTENGPVRAWQVTQSIPCLRAGSPSKPGRCYSDLFPKPSYAGVSLGSASNQLLCFTSFNVGVEFFLRNKNPFLSVISAHYFQLQSQQTRRAIWAGYSCQPLGQLSALCLSPARCQEECWPWGEDKTHHHRAQSSADW